MAMKAYRPLYVIKVGSACIAHASLLDEIAQLTRMPARVLVIAGGALGISRHYRKIGRPIRTLTRPDGEEVRYCPPEEMGHIRAAYRRVTLPALEAGLAARRLTVIAQTADTGGLVLGAPGGPIRTIANGRPRLVRDHRCGQVRHVDTGRLHAMLATFDVVCLSPPIADESGALLTIDADLLSAEASVALDADHLRFVTGTAGVLAVPNDPTSTVPGLVPGEGMSLARGRMRRKVRAAELALRGPADIAVTGPGALTPERTWFWPAPPPAPDLDLLTRAVQIGSVSGDEAPLARYLAGWCRERGLSAEVDAVGNLVVTRGTGQRRLLLLGHLDTVPHRWPARWRGDRLSGRGTVDAKASLCAFLEVAAEIEPPNDVQLRVVGAVEEEISSAGGFYARDNYPADAVIIGEPSGARRLTVGYHGLCKLELSVREPAAHTAGRGVRTAGDRLTDAILGVRAGAEAVSPDVIVAVPAVEARSHGAVQAGSATVEIRVPQGVDVEELEIAVRGAVPPSVRVDVQRATPSVRTNRGAALVRAFGRAFRTSGLSPRFVTKTGTSDMNTLATTWRGVPMVAYGPGDSSLDHTLDEHLDAEEYRLARAVLADAVRNWIIAGATAGAGRAVSSPHSPAGLDGRSSGGCFPAGAGRAGTGQVAR